MLRVGLTGNYGSGKSAVLRIFRDLGAVAIDADEIVSGLLEEKHVLDKLRGLFGDDAFDSGGRLIKSRAGELIFKDRKLRSALEDIIHPLVFETIEGMLKGVTAPLVMIEAALIFERGYEERFDRIISVYTDEETALLRLEKAGIKREHALLRLRSQMPIGDKMRRADYCIDNGSSPEETERQAREIYELLKREAFKRNTLK